MTRPRAITIHGHFYQPPRENPWLDHVEVQDSARPYHDWNARVTAECYASNTAARRLDAENRIVDIVDNLARISFNVGPTLLVWLERERPDVYRAILAADRESRLARGHGNAIAQAYHHAILPLSSRRDKVTEVRWGLADFRHRFGRPAEGMWLPETAADRETLEVLAEEGVGFTILAPRQAARVREAPGTAWRDVGGAIDPRRPYRYDVGPGRSLTLFFYDAPISTAIAFEGLLHSGDELGARLLDGFADGRPWPELCHVATDGESYGHHHRFGDMALAAACDRIEASGAARLTNYAAFLASLGPATPKARVEIVSPSSWSCAHGVDRWRADCGCRVGHADADWHQRWRAPLREALDWLRDALDSLYEARAGSVLKDPWAARDDYIQVVLDRGPASVAAFLDRHQLRQLRPLAAADGTLALTALEMQRHRLLMYTSCGWFFDELSGLEGIQILCYAARAIQLARQLGADGDLEEGFIRRLGKAPSNAPDLGSGEAVYRRRVLPAVTDLDRVAAHYAMAAAFEGYGEAARVYAYRVDRLAWRREACGEAILVVGRLRVTATITGEVGEWAVAVLQGSGTDLDVEVQARVSADLDAEATERVADALFRRCATLGTTPVPRDLDATFGGRAYGIRDLFDEERRRLMPQLRDSGLPVPELFAAEARAFGIAPGLDQHRVAERLEAALLTAVARLEAGWAPEALAEALGVLDLGQKLGVAPELWIAQNRVFRLGRKVSPADRTRLAPLADRLGLRLADTS